MKKVISLILALVMCLSLCACGEGSMTTNSSTSEETKTPNNKEKTIGDVTTVDNFECRIKEVNWYSASDFDFDCIQPEEGFEYIVMVLSEKNTTNETQNAPMINLLSADGKECTNKIGLSLYKKQYKLNFGATLAGATAEAYVIYQIPSGAKSFKFQILSNGFGSSSDYFVFSREDIQ